MRRKSEAPTLAVHSCSLHPFAISEDKSEGGPSKEELEASDITAEHTKRKKEENEDQLLMKRGKGKDTQEGK